jgi:hypothetical protein
MPTAPVGAADIIAQAIKKAKNTGTPCGVAVFLDSLTPGDRAVFIEAMERPPREVPHTALEVAAGSMGTRVTAGMWAHHRLHRCKCW